jgi:hypothetical protein
VCYLRVKLMLETTGSLGRAARARCEPILSISRRRICSRERLSMHGRRRIFHQVDQELSMTGRIILKTAASEH